MKLSLKDKLANVLDWQDKPVKLAFSLYLGLLFLTLAFLLLIWRRLPLQLPLFYSLPWGEEQLGTPLMLLILPSSSLVIGIINFFLAAMFWKSQPLAAKILAWLATSYTLLASLTLVRIILSII